MTKEKLKIKFEDTARYGENEEILIQITELGPSKYELPGVKKGEEVAIINTDGFYGVIPRLEYSAYHNSFKKNVRNKLIKAIIIGKYAASDGTKIIVFSSKQYELQDREDDLQELQEAEFVTGRIIGFNDYSAIVKYKKLHLQLSNADFSDKGDIKIEDVLKINDEIKVVFSKMKKRGRIIKVKPLVPFPKPEYLENINRSELKEGQIVKGKITRTSPKNILILIGKNEGVEKNGKIVGKNSVILASALHPNPVLDEFMIPGIIVDVELTKITEEFIFCKIVDVNMNIYDDNMLKYNMSIKGEQ